MFLSLERPTGLFHALCNVLNQQHSQQTLRHVYTAVMLCAYLLSSCCLHLDKHKLVAMYNNSMTNREASCDMYVYMIYYLDCIQGRTYTMYRCNECIKQDQSSRTVHKPRRIYSNRKLITTCDMLKLLSYTVEPHALSQRAKHSCCASLMYSPLMPAERSSSIRSSCPSLYCSCSNLGFCAVLALSMTYCSSASL
jgi:hypothetical protein